MQRLCVCVSSRESIRHGIYDVWQRTSDVLAVVRASQTSVVSRTSNLQTAHTGNDDEQRAIVGDDTSTTDYDVTDTRPTRRQHRRSVANRIRLKFYVVRAQVERQHVWWHNSRSGSGARTDS